MHMQTYIFIIKGGNTGLAGLVLAGPPFQEGSIQLTKNQMHS